MLASTKLCHIVSTTSIQIVYIMMTQLCSIAVMMIFTFPLLCSDDGNYYFLTLGWRVSFFFLLCSQLMRPCNTEDKPELNKWSILFQGTVSWLPWLLVALQRWVVGPSIGIVKGKEHCNVTDQLHGVKPSCKAVSFSASQLKFHSHIHKFCQVPVYYLITGWFLKQDLISFPPNQ
jgi:hypothetical protein